MHAIKSTATRTGEDPRSGMTLAVVMVLLTAMSMLGGFVFVSSRTDVAIAGNYRRSVEAQYQAEAGVTFVRRQMEQDLQSGSLALTGATVGVSYAAPPGFTYDTVTNLMATSDTNAYAFRVTGRSDPASATVEVVVRRRPLLSAGLLGLALLDMQPNYDVYSYDSRDLVNPAPGDSTGEAVVGSNVRVEISPGCTLDGIVILGADASGNPAVYSGPNSIDSITEDAYASDPLGASNGWLSTQFTYYADDANNDNDTADPPIVNNTINLTPHQTMTLTNGNYYLTSMAMDPNSDLILDTSDGPINIYLAGGFDAGPRSQVNNTGAPTELTLYSNSSSEIRIRPNSTFRGFVYAPYATLRIQPNSGAYGVLWGRDIILLPNGNYYIDMALINSFLSNDLEVTSWKEVRR